MTQRTTPHGTGFVISAAIGLVLWAIFLIFLRPLLAHWIWA